LKRDLMHRDCFSPDPDSRQGNGETGVRNSLGVAPRRQPVPRCSNPPPAMATSAGVTAGLRHVKLTVRRRATMAAWTKAAGLRRAMRPRRLKLLLPITRCALTLPHRLHPPERPLQLKHCHRKRHRHHHPDTWRRMKSRRPHATPRPGLTAGCMRPRHAGPAVCRRSRWRWRRLIGDCTC
jgi:hypothetical protein